MVRFKNRYLLVEVSIIDPKRGLGEYHTINSKLFTSHHISNHLRDNLTLHFGHLLSALTSQSLSVKYCNPITGLLIVRCSRDTLESVWASMTLLTGLGEEKGWIWRVKRVSGTIRSAQKAIMKVSLKKLLEMKKLAKPEEQVKYDQYIAQCSNAIKSIDA